MPRQLPRLQPKYSQSILCEIYIDRRGPWISSYSPETPPGLDTHAGADIASPIYTSTSPPNFCLWGSGRDWLQGFRGATFGRLKMITSHPVGSAQIGDFLEEFQTVALSTSLQNTLSEFKFRTLWSWNPSYSSLLIFKQMRPLEIEFSCHNPGCSSTVNDDIVTSLTRAMPKLEILRLGNAPCSAITGVTLKGLVALACHCSHLSELRIHVQAGELGEATTDIESPGPPENTAVIPRVDCALTVL